MHLPWVYDVQISWRKISALYTVWFLLKLVFYIKICGDYNLNVLAFSAFLVQNRLFVNDICMVWKYNYTFIMSFKIWLFLSVADLRISSCWLLNPPLIGRVSSCWQAPLKYCFQGPTKNQPPPKKKREKGKVVQATRSKGPSGITGRGGRKPSFFPFFLLFTFWNHWNLFWVYQNGNFYWEKAFHTPLKGPHRTLLTGPFSLNPPLLPIVLNYMLFTCML